MDQTKNETEDLIIGNSLFIFAPDNVVRRLLRQFISNSYFAGFIYHMIALNSLLLTLDQPSLEDKYQKKTIEEMLFIISWIFIIECVVKVIVHGFYWGNKTYIKDPWNVLDFIIVIFSVLTMILVEIIDEQKQGNIQFIRGFRALRALRPLRVVSKNEGKLIYYKLNFILCRYQDCRQFPHSLHPSSSERTVDRSALPLGLRNSRNIALQR